MFVATNIILDVGMYFIIVLYSLYVAFYFFALLFCTFIFNCTSDFTLKGFLFHFFMYILLCIVFVLMIGGTYFYAITSIFKPTPTVQHFTNLTHKKKKKNT